MSIGGRVRVPHHAQSNVSSTPSSQPGRANSQLGLFRRSHKFCASNASSCTYSGCVMPARSVNGASSRRHGPVSSWTRAFANQRQVTTTAALYQSDIPRLTRSSCSCSAANHPRANSRTGMFTLSGGIPSKCERRNRTHQGSHARMTTVQHTGRGSTGIRPGLAELTQPGRQWQLTAIEHPDVPAIRPGTARVRRRRRPEPALVGQPLTGNIGVVGGPGVLAPSDV
jgi:hypothetical protein